MLPNLPSLSSLTSLFSNGIGVFLTGVGHVDPTGQADPLLAQLAALLSSFQGLSAHLS